MLTRLVYHSENHLGAAGGGMIKDLNAILAASQRNNEKAGITGALLFDTLWFIQILEGEREAVSGALRRILRDQRHDELVVMDCRPAETRLFGKWWMGFAMLRGDNGALYARHGIGPKLDPRKISGDQMVAVALELAGQGLSRQIAA
jgi:hypothetical protein